MKHTVVFDTEVYRNHFLAAFKNVDTQEVVTVAATGGPLSQEDRDLLRDIMLNDLTIGYNSQNFDIPIVWAAISGADTSTIQDIANAIIVENARTWEIERQYKFRCRKTDHIDLIEVSPLEASLKLYHGRLHGKRMQDLPFEPGISLSEEQIAQLHEYCVNDLAATELLLKSLEEAINMRDQLSIEFRQDLRSKSDAQMGEAIVQSEVERLTGRRPSQPQPARGAFRYEPPEWMSFETPQLQAVFDMVKSTEFRVDHLGYVQFPREFQDLDIRIGSSAYTLGIGGLHSKESHRAIKSDEEYVLLDADVASQYPSIIMKLGLYPLALGEEFLTVYRNLMKWRLEAKANKDKVRDKGLKTAINGLYGKLGSPYSVLYAPHLMIAVTLTGQLSLLMLIERANQAGIDVVSGNTDGVVLRCPRTMFGGVDGVYLNPSALQDITGWWEGLTGFKLEFAEYAAMYNSSVNTYVAVRSDGECKNKGAFGNPWSADPPDYRGQLSKNPQTTICIDAVIAWLTNGTPIADTIHLCTDIRQFVTVRKVNGGAVWQGQYLGKAVRWYYAKGQFEPIRYATNGNRVSKSDGAMPCMELPDALPADVDYEWYVREAESMLVDIGAVAGPRRRGEPDERQVDLFAA